MITTPNVKINLGLNILRKGEDGFHDLETLFVPYFGIHDTLEIITGEDYSRTSAALFAKYGSGIPASQGSVKPEGVFGVETEEVSTPKIVQGISEDGSLMITIARAEGVDWDPLKDLTAKAYYILAEDFNLPPVKIFLEKTSPVGAGLGGGSADAAFALKMLNEMCGLGLSEQQLAAYASRLGSDCAFFVYNCPMIGEGRGEILSAFALDSIDYGCEPCGNGAASQYEIQISNDGGIDGYGYHIDANDFRTTRVVIQCKRYNVAPVSEPEINQFLGAMNKYQADYGVFITNGRFTNAAKTAAREGSPITLIDGNELVRLVIRYELYITPVKTYVLDEFYNTES